MEKILKTDPEIRREINNVIRDKSLYYKLLEKANLVLKRYPQLQRVCESADVISQLCFSIINASRKWDKAKCGSLFVHMLNNIKSTVSNMSKNKECKKKFKYDEDETDDEFNCAMDESVPDKWKQDEEFDTMETVRIVDKIVEGLSDECQLVYQCMKERKTNQEISDDLGINSNQVVNIKKQLKRKIQKNTNKITN